MKDSLHDLNRNQEKVLLGVSLIIGGLVLILVFAGTGEEKQPGIVQDNGSNYSYAASNNDTVIVVNKEASSVFKIEEYGVEPYRRNIDVGENVAFENNRGDRVTIEFDRSSTNLVLNPGDRTSIRVTGTTYVDFEGSNGWEGDAQIYVE